MNKRRWPLYPLGDVLEREADWINVDPDAEYRQVTVKLWGAGVALRRVVKGSDIAATSQIRVRGGQFIMSRIDARHGAFGLVPKALDGAIVSQDFPVFETSEDLLLPEFLSWMSKTEWFVTLCRVASEGSTNRVRLKEDRFLNHKVPLPPVDEQRRIVVQLDGLASGVEQRTRAATAMEAELDAALRAAFHKIVADAPRARMRDVAPLVRRPVEVDPEGMYPELGVRSFGKGTFHKPELSGLDVGTKRLFRIEKNDLLFNIVFAWEGAVAVARSQDHGRVGSHRFLTCVPDSEKTSPEFLRYFFLTDEGLQQLGDASPGGAGRNRTLGLNGLELIEVPLPPIEAQRWFDTLQARAAVARACSAQAAAELKNLIPAVLHQVF